MTVAVPDDDVTGEALHAVCADAVEAVAAFLDGRPVRILTAPAAWPRRRS